MVLYVGQGTQFTQPLQNAINSGLIAMTKNNASAREERIRTAMEAVPISELITELARTDPEYAARVNSTRVAAAPILPELDGLGYKLETLAQLRHLGRPWKSALPVLLRWLPLVEDKDIQEEIVRSLSVPWIGNQATQRLIDLIRVAPSSSSLAWAIGNALSIVDVSGFEDQIISLCLDSKYSTARQMLVMSLPRFKDTQAENAALQLLNDEAVQMHAIIALGKMRSRRALPKLDVLLNDKKAPIRRVARKAIASISASEKL
jgi:hypothetical protein